MKSFRGYFKFPCETFPFTSLTSLGDNISFTELKDVFDINEHEVKSILIEYTEQDLSNPIEINIVLMDGTSSTTYTNLSYINQDLDEVLFGSYIEGMGKISTTLTDSTTLNNLKECFDDTKNVIFLYRLNSERSKVTKSLVWVSTQTVKFNNPIKIRDMLLDVKMKINDERFNYVYISSLHRFYFITDMMLTNDYARLTLHEDVLSSWDELIRSQTAFVERNENDIDADKVDDYIYADYDKTVTYSTISPTNDIFDIAHPNGTGVGYWVLLGVA